ncbi:hypothetical protein VFPBJ_01138 [Purpureocillium lilacinum]|uniref:CVNH domain-containing protein n=3 Tax=Purpureocillium lilacinum TaxID=33203 RepID=A0A179HBT2_PURLI|nr:hypothetical protein Purlil1_5399 [Purpureocillium lilacinum]OAQ87098.1 hypothetical protein VFPBJ_01138 [Purpureocillium lilacinum]
MIAQQIITIVVLAAGASAAVVEARARTCTLALHTLNTQMRITHGNPVGGGDATYTCGANLDYGDRRKQTLSTNCHDITRNGCYNSQLPNRICIHTNSNLSDGYLDYGKEHRDFNEKGCEHTGWATSAGHKFGITCHFPCT